MSYHVKTQPDSPSELENLPPWRKRQVIDTIVIEDVDVQIGPVSKRKTPRPAFEPMQFSSSAAFMAHLQQVDPLIEQIKKVLCLKKYYVRFDTYQQSCMQLEADLRNYPPGLQADAQEQTSQKLVRLRRYILELQNRKYCLLWNEMCERCKSPVSQLHTRSESGCENEPEVADPRVGSEQYRTLRQNAGVSQLPSVPSTESPSTNNLELSEPTKPIPATCDSRESNLKAGEPSKGPAEPLIRNNEAGKSVKQEPEECKVAADGSQANSRPNGLPVISPAASPKRRGSGDPNSTEDESKQNFQLHQQSTQNPDSTSSHDFIAAFNSRPNGFPEKSHAAFKPPKRNSSGDAIPKSTAYGRSKLNLGPRRQSHSPDSSGRDFADFNTRRWKRSTEMENDRSDQSPREKIPSFDPRPSKPVEANIESHFQPFHRGQSQSNRIPKRPFYSNKASNGIRRRLSARNRPSRRQFVPSYGVSASKPNRRCLFCQGQHESHHCTIVNTLDERIAFFDEKNLCPNCSGRKHEYECGRHYCQWKCGTEGFHHSALCPQAPDPITKRVFRSPFLGSRDTAN